MNDRSRFTPLAVCFWLLFTGTNSYATLTGDSVGASIVNNDTSPPYYFLPTPFSTPKIVDSGAEFTSWLQDPSYSWGTFLDLDIRGDGFDIIFRDHTPSYLAGAFGRSFRIDIFDLNPSPNLRIIGMSFRKLPPLVQTRVSDWGYTSDTAYVQLDGFNSGSTRSFDFQYAPVPEPATMLLYGFGIVALAAYRAQRAVGWGKKEPQQSKPIG